MYTKAKLFGHPIHPMLVSIPISMYAAACASFVAYSLGAEAIWFRIGVYANVAGVVGAVIAAVPGLIDWIFGVPTGSPAKATGLLHMAANVVALLLFALNASLHWPHRFESAPVIGSSVALTVLGVCFTLLAGFLGWKMVQVHHVGIDLTPEQRRLEPRASPRIERSVPIGSRGHGHQHS
jgi:uncharacterized membrane protein